MLKQERRLLIPQQSEVEQWCSISPPESTTSLPHNAKTPPAREKWGFCKEITREVGGGLPFILSTSSALGDLVRCLESGSYVFQACLQEANLKINKPQLPCKGTPWIDTKSEHIQCVPVLSGAESGPEFLQSPGPSISTKRQVTSRCNTNTRQILDSSSAFAGRHRNTQGLSLVPRSRY